MFWSLQTCLKSHNTWPKCYLCSCFGGVCRCVVGTDWFREVTFGLPINKARCQNILSMYTHSFTASSSPQLKSWLDLLGFFSLLLTLNPFFTLTYPTLLFLLFLLHHVLSLSLPPCFSFCVSVLLLCPTVNHLDPCSLQTVCFRLLLKTLHWLQAHQHPTDTGSSKPLFVSVTASTWRKGSVSVSMQPRAKFLRKECSVRNCHCRI